MIPIGSLKIEIVAKTAGLQSGLALASSRIRDFSLVATGLTQGITNAFQLITSVGIKSLVVGLGTLGGAFALTAKSGADFEDNMVRAFAILKESSGALSGDLKSLTDEAIRLGNDTLYSATQAAEGFQVLARAGFDTSEILSATNDVINLAIVGNISMSEASTIAASSMHGFGLAATDMGRITDMLSKASTLANTDIQGLGSAMSYVAPIAKLAGMSYAETAAALDVLANSGIRGSKSGTTLRRMLSVLVAPTGRAKAQFDKLGLSFIDSSGKVDSLKVAIKKLEGAGLGAGQIMEMFGLRAGPGAAALLALGSGAVENLTNKIQDSAGAAERMSQEMRTSVKGRIMDLKASVVGLGLGFSEEFKGGLADAIFGVRNFIKEITEAWKKTGVFKAIVDGIVSSFSPVTAEILKSAESFKQFALSLTPEKVAEAFDSIKSKVQEFVATFKQNMDMAITVVKGIALVVTLFVTAVIKTILFFGKLHMATDGVSTKIMALFGAIVILMGGIVNLGAFLITLSLMFGSYTIAATTATGATTTFAVGLGPAIAALWSFISPLALTVGIGLGVIAMIVGLTAVINGLIGVLFEGKTYTDAFNESLQMHGKMFGKLGDIVKKIMPGMKDFKELKEEMASDGGDLNMFGGMEGMVKELKANMEGTDVFDGLAEQLQQAVKDGASTAEIGKIMSGATSGKSDSGKKDKGVLLDGIYYKSKQARKAVASIIARRKEKGEPEQKINKNSPSELLKDALLQKEAADKKRKITEEYENSIIMASQNTQLMAINKHKDYQEQYIQTERDFNMSMHAIHAQALAIRKQRAQAAAYNPAGMSIDDIAKKHKVVGGISNASSAVSGIASGAKKEPYSGITDYQSNQIMLGGLNKVQGVGGYSEETLKMGKSIHTAETVNLRLKNRNNAQMMAYLRQIGATQAETKAAEEALSGEIRSLKATKGVKIGNDNSVNVSDFN